MVDTFQKFKALNKHTEVYCGHEYTIANLQFALSIDPTNEALVAKYEWGNTVEIALIVLESTQKH